VGLLPLTLRDGAAAGASAGRGDLEEDSLVAKLRAADSLLQSRRRKKLVDAVSQIRGQRPRIFHSSNAELLKLEKDVKAWAAENIKRYGNGDINTPHPMSHVQALNLLSSDDSAASALQLLLEAHAVAARIAELGLERGT
jgi:hypothetical protein